MIMNEILSKSIISKLLNYQIPHCYKLYFAFQNNNVILDASDTGTGKTYCSLALCKQLNLRPIIICPKTIIQSWSDVCKHFDLEPEVIINYDKVINSSLFKNDKIFPFIFKIETIENNNKKILFEWNLLPNHIIILDEVHRCKNSKTLHSKLLYSLKNVNNKVMLLSATLADKVKLFKNFGYLMKFYPQPKSFTKWINSKMKLYHTKDKSLALNKYIFPNYGGRMRIKDLGEMFPKNYINADCYKMKNADKIAEQYNIIDQAYQDLKNKSIMSRYFLETIIRARQMIELLKIPTFISLIKENISNGKSTALFVNFNETLTTIANEFNTTCVVHGKQTMSERLVSINDFQTNKSNLVILNIKAGGVGLSLHDLIGSHQRVSIISPTWSAQDLVQTLGRIHRAGAKTDAIQKLVFCTGTVEEFICNNISTKLSHLSKLNDGDLDSYIIEGLNDKKNNVDEFEMVGDSNIVNNSLNKIINPTNSKNINL